MSRAVFYDKVGGSEALEVRPGQPLRDVLRANGIPANSVLALVNGKIVSDDVAVIQPDDYVELRQVRHYDLGIVRKPPRKVYSAIDPVYTKSVLFDENGELEVRSEQLDEAGYLNYVEQAFVESVVEANLIEDGDHIVTGLSGGRDSVSFLTLLERTRDRLPPFSMTAVTVTGMPDWEEPATFRIAQECCESLGVEQLIVDSEAIEETFRLNRPFGEVMNEIVKGPRAPMIMIVGHHVMRRMIEIEAGKLGHKKIALGFNADDLVASLVTWFTSGFQMGPIPMRPIGSVNYVFPLFRISKKELTLYLELLIPSRNTQGAPGRFTTGPPERSLAYAIADHLFDLYPGIDYYLFEAFSQVQRYTTPPQEAECNVCGGVYQVQADMRGPSGLCDVCDLFGRSEFTRPS
jgi:sulfur carrier protein ThiS